MVEFQLSLLPLLMVRSGNREMLTVYSKGLIAYIAKLQIYCNESSEEITVIIGIPANVFPACCPGRKAAGGHHQ